MKHCITVLLLIVSPIAAFCQVGWFKVSGEGVTKVTALSESDIYAATPYDSGFVLRHSTNSGMTWTSYSINFHDGLGSGNEKVWYEIKGIAYTRTQECIVYGGKWNSNPLGITSVANAISTSDEGRTWHPSAGHPYGMVTHFQELEDGSLLFTIGGSEWDYEPGHCWLQRRSPSGTWDEIELRAGRFSLGGGEDGITLFVNGKQGYYADVDSHLYAGLRWITNDSGNTWQSIDSVRSQESIDLQLEHFQFGRDSILFAADTTTEFRSTNNGQTWQIVDQALPLNSAILAMKGMAVYAQGDNELYYSRDAGLTWTGVDQPPGSITQLEIVNDTVAYCAAGGLLYKTRTSGVKSAVRTTSVAATPVTLSLNSFEDALTVSADVSEICFIDMLGREIRRIRVPKGMHRLDVSGIPNGAYFVKLDERNVERVIIAH